MNHHALVSYITQVMHRAKASRKFKEFWYKRSRYFVKYSCTQESVAESSKSYDERKWLRN